LTKKKEMSLTYDPLIITIVHEVFTLNIPEERKIFNNKEIVFLIVNKVVL